MLGLAWITVLVGLLVATASGAHTTTGTYVGCVLGAELQLFREKYQLQCVGGNACHVNAWHVTCTKAEFAGDIWEGWTCDYNSVLLGEAGLKLTVVKLECKEYYSRHVSYIDEETCKLAYTLSMPTILCEEDQESRTCAARRWYYGVLFSCRDYFPICLMEAAIGEVWQILSRNHLCVFIPIGWVIVSVLHTWVVLLCTPEQRVDPVQPTHGVGGHLPDTDLPEPGPPDYRYLPVRPYRPVPGSRSRIAPQ